MIRKMGIKSITGATPGDGGIGGTTSYANVAAGGTSNSTIAGGSGTVAAAFYTPSTLKPLNEDESAPDTLVKSTLSFDRICKLYYVGIRH